MKNLNSNWVTEVFKDTALSFKIKEKLYSKKSKFQHIEIYETEKHGNLMSLDGCYMVTEKEEFVYHEMLVHIPLFSHPNPQNILVIGGGDGGTVREILKHQCVKSIDFVEIDEDVYKLSKIYFKNLTRGLANDKRVNFLFGDGIKFVKEKKNFYDVILVDSTDPSDISGGLFSTDFFKDVYKALKKDGIMVMQSESPFYDGEIISNVQQRLKKIFNKTYLYLAFIPIYPSGCWSFSCGSKKYSINKIRNKKSVIKGLKYYTHNLHKSILSLPQFVMDLMK